jgi:hypothetical protein
LLAAFIAVWALYLLAATSLLIAALAAIHSLWPREYREDPNPRQLFRRRVLDRPVERNLWSLGANFVSCYEANE